MKLVDISTGAEIKVGDKVFGKGGKEFILKGVIPPQTSVSVGSFTVPTLGMVTISTLDNSKQWECYPSMIGLKFDTGNLWDTLMKNVSKAGED